MQRILFVSENVSIAQVVRLASLASTLDSRYEVHFACGDFPPLLFKERQFKRHSLFTLDRSHVMDAMRRGRQPYALPVLEQYLRADRNLIDAVRPDLILGDFRLTLGTASELRQRPYASLINSYFSPYAANKSFPVPDHPTVKWLGETVTAAFFPIARPWAFRRFVSPLNRLRSRVALPPIPSLPHLLASGDHTLYPDVPELAPVHDAPASHVFLGPVLWSPKTKLPKLGPRTRPLVYVTLGSSGRLDVLPAVLEALATLPVRVVAATAGRSGIVGAAKNITCVDFAPGQAMARLADVVICNGGSTTGYQALAEGTPVLGLPSNMDQFLASRAMTQQGSALEVKARCATAPLLRAAIERLLEEPSFSAAAQTVAGWFEQRPSQVLFPRWIRSL